MLQPPSNRREHILVFGREDTGKTTTWINIATWLARTSSPAKIRVLDTDGTWEASRPIDGSLDGTVVVEDLQGAPYSEYKPALDRLVANPSRDDWLVVDMADQLWNRAQQGGFEMLTDREWDEFIAYSVKNDMAIGGDYGKNWGVINKMYGALIDRVLRWPGHWLLVTPQTEVREANKQGKGGEEDPSIRSDYGRIGFKPDGQKKLPHLPHTVLWMQHGPKGTRVMTAVKDRGREKVKGVALGDGENMEPGFVVKYLMQVAGWKP